MTQINSIYRVKEQNKLRAVQFSYRMPQNEHETSQASLAPRDDPIQQALLIAAKLKDSQGQRLNDDSLLAVSEATGADVERVRIALNSLKTFEKPSSLSRLRNAFLALDPAVRRYVTAGYFAGLFGLTEALIISYGDPSSLLGILRVLFIIGAIWNCMMSTDSKISTMAGAIFGGGLFITNALFLMVIGWFRQVPENEPASMFLLFAGVGALGGLLCYKLGKFLQKKLGVKKPLEERQELLRQLVEIQDKLRAGEKSMAFLSVDIVGSTRMKEHTDPLALEFTFSEYHKFIESIVKRYNGHIHSTAGDGVTCAFDHPHQAFSAGRHIQSGLIELNTHRNKIGVPIQLRCGIHYGSVMASPGQDIKTINFSHVIDMASHLQKACPIGGITISQKAADNIQESATMIGSERISVQSMEALIWRPKLPPPSFALPLPSTSNEEQNYDGNDRTN